MRYFRCLPAVYEGIASDLDAAYGYPNADTKTERAIPLLSALPKDAQGRVYLAVQDVFCEFILPSQMLPELIASGVVEELTESQYSAVLPAPQPL